MLVKSGGFQFDRRDLGVKLRGFKIRKVMGLAGGENLFFEKNGHVARYYPGHQFNL